MDVAQMQKIQALMTEANKLGEELNRHTTTFLTDHQPCVSCEHPACVFYRAIGPIHERLLALSEQLQIMVPR